ncbi:MAG TPA: hypothetical protein VMH78_04070 [Thermoplasmata archaeon]|nr:hypothetical protein [Thermoplasmata archaeon]
MCGRTVCRECLDEDERYCPECTQIRKRAKGAPGSPHPPSRRVGRT